MAMSAHDAASLMCEIKLENAINKRVYQLQGIAFGKLRQECASRLLINLYIIACNLNGSPFFLLFFVYSGNPSTDIACIYYILFRLTKYQYIYYPLVRTR